MTDSSPDTDLRVNGPTRFLGGTLQESSNVIELKDENGHYSV